MIIETADIKKQLRIETTDEDAYLEALGSAAVEAFQNYTGTILFSFGTDLTDEPDNSLIVSESIKLGALLLIGHWYENRETTTKLQLSKVQMATEYLWNPYRIIAL